MAVLCGIILLYDPCGIIYTKTAKHRRRTKREKTENPKPPPEMHGRFMLMLWEEHELHNAFDF